jgi:hypothetical protein
MKNIRGLLAALVAACAFLSAGGASATVIPVNQWEEFSFGATGSALAGCTSALCIPGDISVFAPVPPWTFTCATSCTLVVTDGFSSVDQFQFFDNLVSLGLTSAPTPGSNCGGAVLTCLGDAAFSHGSFSLAAGAHSITGIATLSPLQAGAAFFIVRAQAVPELSTILLLGMGLLSIGVMLRKRV